MKYKAVIFDLDGTLLDTIEDLADATNAMLATQNFPPHTVDEYKIFVGDGMRSLVRRALPEGHKDDATVARCLPIQKEEYGRRWDKKTRPYAGIPQLLDALRAAELKLAVLSNKPDAFTQIVVQKFLPDWWFDAVRGESEITPKKPDPAGALSVAAQLEVAPGQVLYLGDTNTDMRTANAAGMYAVGVTWGFRTARELVENGAQTLIDRPTDLLRLLA